ncbi:magnesium/cobalt transporter CorA [bacterium]|nr:magnesium/cobalt transporter CorA [bacterium]MBU1072746.1 magnesium/cobalt transporter CorA [bacterium]MBU1677068.1 magnesium/cobalt transporter CorA [bacterium]
MVKLHHRVRKPAAQAPGTVEFHGEKRVERVTIKVIDYQGDRFEEREIDDFHECFTYRNTDTVTWINVNGLHDTDLLRELGAHYGLHSLVLEDIVNTHQRPKMEDFGDYIYLVCRMLSFNSENLSLASEQLSLVLGRNFVLSFQERPGDVLEPVRERLRLGKGRIRTNGPGYLSYALVDAVVDHYFTVLEGFGDEIETLEEELLLEPGLDALQRIHHLKREIVLLRRAVWPLREVVSRLDREELPLLGAHVRPYLRDLYDHVIHVADSVDSFRDLLSGLQDLYLSSVSNRMNEVMKVLTIFASIFVPLTFLAGVYGMNFTYMPELGWRWSYPIFWLVTLALGGVLLLFFHRRKWL